MRIPSVAVAALIALAGTTLALTSGGMRSKGADGTLLAQLGGMGGIGGTGGGGCSPTGTVCCNMFGEPALYGMACIDDGNLCTEDHCDGAGSCIHPNRAEGFACTMDGNECTDDVCDGAGSCGVDEPDGTACSGGLCVGGVCGGECTPGEACCDAQGQYAAEGTACADDGNACTDDVCDGAGVCSHPATVAGTACAADGNQCTDDVCDGAGSCGIPSSPDEPCTDDANECTDDACDGLGACSHDPVADGTACTEGYCASGECTWDCLPDGECCDGTGQYEPAYTLCADDGNACTDDVCDGAGVCSHPATVAGTACAADGNQCTDDVCDGAGSCGIPTSPGEACADDGNACTDDACDGLGACSHGPVADGTACPGGACKAGACVAAPSCGDGVVNGGEECDYAVPGETFCTLGCSKPSGGNSGGGGGIGGEGPGGSSSSGGASSIPPASSAVAVWCCTPEAQEVDPVPQDINTCAGTKFNTARVAYPQAVDRCGPLMWCCIHDNFTCENLLFTPIGASQEGECFGPTFTRGTIFFSPDGAAACAAICS